MVQQVSYKVYSLEDMRADDIDYQSIADALIRGNKVLVVCDSRESLETIFLAVQDQYYAITDSCENKVVSEYMRDVDNSLIARYNWGGTIGQITLAPSNIKHLINCDVDMVVVFNYPVLSEDKLQSLKTLVDR